MITFEMVQRGYEQGIVRLVESPNGDGPVCAIGDDWFYFPGVPEEAMEGEMTVAEFQAMVSKEELVQNIFDVLDCDMRPAGSGFGDMYRYFEGFLNDHLKEVSMMHENLKEMPVGSLDEQADALIAANPALAKAVFSAIQRQYDRENMIGRIKEHSDFNIENFADEDIDEIVDRFNEYLNEEDDYWTSYWGLADDVILEVAEEVGVGEKPLAEKLAHANARSIGMQGPGARDLGPGMELSNSLNLTTI